VTRPLLCLAGVAFTMSLVAPTAARAAGVPMLAVQAEPAAAEALRAAGAMDVLSAVAEVPAWLVRHGIGWR
jgi:hypothetical protein